MAWHHYPLVDGDIPKATNAGPWSIVGDECRALLRDGFNVLIHCKGGLGRAGTIAAKLLAELGVFDERAIELVRDARPGAIENAMQACYVTNVGFCAEPLPDRSDECIADSALLGRARRMLAAIAVPNFAVQQRTDS